MPPATPPPSSSAHAERARQVAERARRRPRDPAKPLGERALGAIVRRITSPRVAELERDK